jgi:hypothetical protein
MHVSECATVQRDQDDDGLDDRCELSLARAFAPELVVDRRDCLWAEDSLGGRLAGGYFFAVGRMPGGVRVAYLPAYFRDCGWSGRVCVLRPGNCGAHAGDSEMILVDAAPSAEGAWRVTGIFLSAHCFGRSDGRCRWYRGRELESFEMAESGSVTPRIWVARGKHANYPSRDACDSGHWFYDSCDGNASALRFPIRSDAQNIGSASRPAHGDACVATAQLPLGALGASRDGRECFRDPGRPFTGWQSPANGTASPYARYLREIADL